MNAEELRNYCLDKKEVTESLPFGEDILVFKVFNKMFLLMALNKDPLSISVKTSPERSVLLREEYPEITPGYHLNKKHWNSLKINGNVPSSLIFSLIDESYRLVVNSLPKKLKNKIK